MNVHHCRVNKDMPTEEQIQAWVAEAEADCDVAALKRRGRGYPGHGAEPVDVVTVPLTADELAALDVIADRGQVTRAEAIRQVLAVYAA